MEKILKYVLFGLICIVSLFIVWGFMPINDALCCDTEEVLRQAVEVYVAQETAEVPHYYFNHPSGRETGEYYVRTHRLADTTFTTRTKKVDPIKERIRGSQYYLFLADNLRPKSIHMLFDSLLHEKGVVSTQSAIGVISSFYKGMNEWSGDTTALAIDHRSVLANEEEYDLINYYAYVDYSLATYWERMPRSAIYTLLALIFLSGSALFYLKRKDKIAKRAGITLLSNGTYRLGDTFIRLEKRSISTGKRKEKLTEQHAQILSLFLMSDSHRILKNDIQKELWSKHTDPRSILKNAVTRTNKKLREMGCPYAIVSDPEDEEYYVLLLADFTE